MRKKTEVLANPRLFVPWWFETNKVNSASGSYLFDTLWLDYREAVITLDDEDFRGVSEKDMQKAFGEFLRQLPIKEIQKLADTLVCSVPSLHNLSNWVQAVVESPSAEDLQVMAHWCWLVKRKIMGMPVIHHIMPIVVGPQGSGKTVAISKLISPLESCRLTADVPMLSEQSTYQAMANHAVIMFDELAGIQRMDMNVLKRQISAETNSFRPLYKQEMSTVPQRCSFIGASNRKIDESIFDATGMRRFFQLISPKRVNWEVINSINYLELWQGIDENLPEGYLVGDTLKSVHTIQANYVVQDDVDLFIETLNLAASSPELVKEVEAKFLYSEYRMWANTHGVYKPLTYIMFNKKLANRGIEPCDKRTSGGGRIKCFRVNSASQVLGTPIEAQGNLLTFKTEGVQQ